MKSIRSLSIVFLSVFMFCVVSCSKDDKYNEHNINFYQVSNSVAQQYSAGNWRLIYSRGGIAGLTIQARNNDYMILSRDRIKIGNDSVGMLYDASITWEQQPWGSLGTANFFTYYFGNSLPAEKLLEEIRNDTLIISDFGPDGFRSFYKRY